MRPEDFMDEEDKAAMQESRQLVDGDEISNRDTGILQGLEETE
jgi:hypothetical protein